MCPDALIAIVTNPLNSLVPLAAGVLKKRGVYRPERLFGICQIDQMRAKRFYAEAIGQEPKKVYVPVVGGHGEITTVPLFSKARPNVPLTVEETITLINQSEIGREKSRCCKIYIISANNYELLSHRENAFS